MYVKLKNKSKRQLKSKKKRVRKMYYFLNYVRICIINQKNKKAKN